MNLQEILAAIKRWTPHQQEEFSKLLKDQEYSRLQTEYDLQEEQRRILDSKPANEGDDYGMPEYTP